MKDNVASLLAYFTLPAIIFLLMEPYNKNPMIRFHSFQCLFLFGVQLVVQFGFRIVVGTVPMSGVFLGPVMMLFGLAIFAAWIVCMIKAYGGEMFKLPIIGDMAAQQAEKV